MGDHAACTSDWCEDVSPNHVPVDLASDKLILNWFHPEHDMMMNKLLQKKANEKKKKEKNRKNASNKNNTDGKKICNDVIVNIYDALFYI